jgi:hypothetical protein
MIYHLFMPSWYIIGKLDATMTQEGKKDRAIIS